jgi:hypothetical protein
MFGIMKEGESYCRLFLFLDVIYLVFFLSFGLQASDCFFFTIFDINCDKGDLVMVNVVEGGEWKRVV